MAYLCCFMGWKERVKDFRNVRDPEVLGLCQKHGVEATDSCGVREAEGEHKRCKAIW